ncbi:MAG TPA: hypothetical protein VKU41_09050, partial [Polyangiaceae bacterium]|nr:hypothetical protein [Polyangiaceae bacterium]
GDHLVETTAPSRYPSAMRLTIHERDALRVDLKPGEPLAPPAGPEPPAPLPQPAPPRASFGLWPLTLSLGAAALAAGGVAAFLEAGQARADGRAACARLLTCDAQRNTVRAWDWAAASAWIAAAGGAVVAVVLWTGGPRRAERADLRLGVGSLALAGAF